LWALKWALAVLKRRFVPMFLSKRSSGFYHLFYFDDHGTRHKVSTGSKLKSEALKFLQSFNQQQRTKRNKSTLLSQFSEDYLIYSRNTHRPSSTGSVQTSLRELLRILGDRPIQSIGVREGERFVGLKQKEASSRTARVYLVTLASAFETAKRWGLIEVNPFRKVEKPRLPELTPAYLTTEQFQVLTQSIQDKAFRDFVFCAAMTGLRLGELTALRWEDVDFEHRLLHVRNSADFTTKSKRNRVVPMNRWVCKALDCRRPPNLTGLVFNRYGMKLKKEYVSHRFKKAIRALGFDEKLHFHSLRHTFASWLVQRGVPLYDVQRLMGHSTYNMTQVYSHLLPEQLHKSVERLEAGIQ
jgi:integrase